MLTIREGGFSRGGFSLNRSRIWQYIIDNVSNPDGWQFGFEIVYRVEFYFHEDGQEDHLRDVAEFQEVFKHAFDLSVEHYEFGPSRPVSSTYGPAYWRVYWDKGPLDLRILGRCEAELHTAALMRHVTVELISLAVIPRSLAYIGQQVSLRRKALTERRNGKGVI